MTGLSRRRFMAGLAAAPISAGLATATAAPPDTPETWIAYEARLRARLLDSGGGYVDEQLAQALLRATNAARAAAGVAPLAPDPELARAAQAHAADMCDRAYVEHLAPEGFDPSHRLGVLARRRIGSAAENIAYSRHVEAVGADHLMGLWRKSPPHWRNLVNPSHALAGVGAVRNGQRTYAVALYGRPAGALGADLPFQLHEEAALVRALARSSPPVDSFSLTDPTSERLLAAPAPADSPPRLARGVYELRPRRALGLGRVEVLWGPIFVRV